MFQSKDAQFTALKAAMTAALGDQNWLESLQIGENGEALLILRADPDNLPASERRRKLAIEAALSVDGITDAKAVMTAERPTADNQDEEQAP
ncbi:MAG: hypothetical protein AAF683_08805, partial [Pseudomonadota bacterium]